MNTLTTTELRHNADRQEPCFILARLYVACGQIDALEAAMTKIVEKCDAPVDEMAQREAVHFAFNTARAALNKTSP